MGMHNHRCASAECGTVWCHDNRTIPDTYDGCAKAHACPKCGREQYVKAESTLEPEFCSNGARTLPVTPESEPELCKRLSVEGVTLKEMPISKLMDMMFTELRL